VPGCVAVDVPELAGSGVEDIPFPVVKQAAV